MIRRGFSVKEAMSLAEIDEETGKVCIGGSKSGLRAAFCGPFLFLIVRIINLQSKIPDSADTLCYFL